MISFTLLGMVALATAQSSTVSLFLPEADGQSLVASIAGSDSTATTYVVACANSAAAASAAAELSSAAAAAANTAAATTGSAAATTGGYVEAALSLCPYPSPVTIIEGPSTVHYTIDIAAYASASLDCSLSGTSYAACTVSSSGQGAALASATAEAAGTGASLPSGVKISGDLLTTTFTGADAMTMYNPVVITAGSATAKAVSSTTTGAAVKGGSTMSTGSSKSGSSTGSSTGTSTGTSSAAAKSTNGAMAAVPVLGAGMFGAFGVVVAGAIL